ncbi:MAG: AAA family ATPase [Anaerolineae bacterium]|nr:AAA family ATPase [Anaerolineae bacterium]
MARQGWATMTPPLPPHNPEIEEALLGSLLINPEAIVDIAVLVRPGDFYQGRHGLIYQAMVDLEMNDKEVDFLTLTDLLERRGQLDSIGGPAYITRLINSTPSSLHAPEYADTVARHAVRRAVINAGSEIVAHAYDTNSGDPVTFMRERIAELEKRQPSLNAKGSTWADLDAAIGPIEWAWPSWLPKGFLCEIVGEQETGKSILALRIAACFLRAEPWPDGSAFEGEAGKVLWAEAEASQAVNLQRAKSWGLPIENILHPVRDTLEDVQLNDNRHRAAITALTRHPDVQLVIVDSLSGGHQAEEKSASGMIPTLKWLAELARDTGKPVILTHHLRKRGLLDSTEHVTLDRVRGSSGITQLARMVWAVDTPDLKKPDDRRLSVIKSNLAAKPAPLGFTVEDGRLVFGDAPAPPQQQSKLEEAIEFLQVALVDGPVASGLMDAAAKEAGISESTLKRAKKRLGIQAAKNGDGWQWVLPVEESA